MNLEKLVSSSVRRKIIKSLGKVDSLTIIQLVRKIDSTYNQVNSNLLVLSAEGIVTEQRIGRLRMIRLNKENPKTTLILQALKILEVENNKK